MQASNCDRCYRRKSRCDKQQPCSSCAHADVSCEYTDKVRQRRFTSEDVERIEKRLRRSEARNRSLLEEVVRLKANNDQSHISPSGTEQSQATDGTRRADALSEVSYLSINAAGERQPYLGSTSGVLFADLVRSSVDASVSRQGTPQASISELHDGQTTPSAPSIRNSRTHQDLPPHALASKLLQSYFEHDAIAFPFLSPAHLLSALDRFYSLDSYYLSRASPHEVFTFNMTLAIATASVYKYDWQMLPSAESHHARAMRELDQVLARGGLECLQAILLLCQYRQGSSIKDNSASMWHLVGVAARICLELGLHKESVYPLKYSKDPDQSTLTRYRQQEISRRCFWCLIAMDRVTSNILGRPLAIRDEDIDALLPTVDVDDALGYPASASLPAASRTSVFNTIIKYRMLCGRVLTILHRRRSPETTTIDALGLRDDLAQSLEAWWFGVEHLEIPEDAVAGTSERSCFLSPIWYRVLYANAKLSIWRPCPLLADLSQDQLSLQNIYDSSIQAITAYAALHKTRKINYSWITLQSIFMAGLSYLYSVSRHFRKQRDQTSGAPACLLETVPQAIDISQISRACSNVMVAVAERWNALRHCYEVFDRLSDAVLADALNMQSRPTATSGPQPQTPADTSSDLPSSSNNAQTSHLTSSAALESHDASMNPSLYWNGQRQPPNLDTTPNPQSSLAVDSEFLNCYDDLQSMYMHQVEDPVMHLSQDWLGLLGGTECLFEQGGEVHRQFGMFE